MSILPLSFLRVSSWSLLYSPPILDSVIVLCLKFLSGLLTGLHFFSLALPFTVFLKSHSAQGCWRDDLDAELTVKLLNTSDNVDWDWALPWAPALLTQLFAGL